jgi:hypothetical protein
MDSPGVQGDFGASGAQFFQVTLHLSREMRALSSPKRMNGHQRVSVRRDPRVRFRLVAAVQISQRDERFRQNPSFAEDRIT